MCFRYQYVILQMQFPSILPIKCKQQHSRSDLEFILISHTNLITYKTKCLQIQLNNYHSLDLSLDFLYFFCFCFCFLFLNGNKVHSHSNAIAFVFWFKVIIFVFRYICYTCWASLLFGCYHQSCKYEWKKN